MIVPIDIYSEILLGAFVNFGENAHGLAKAQPLPMATSAKGWVWEVNVPHGSMALAEAGVLYTAPIPTGMRYGGCFHRAGSASVWSAACGVRRVGFSLPGLDVCCRNLTGHG